MKGKARLGVTNMEWLVARKNGLSGFSARNYFVSTNWTPMERYVV